MVYEFMCNVQSNVKSFTNRLLGVFDKKPVTTCYPIDVLWNSTLSVRARDSSGTPFVPVNKRQNILVFRSYRYTKDKISRYTEKKVPKTAKEQNTYFLYNET